MSTDAAQLAAYTAIARSLADPHAVSGYVMTVAAIRTAVNESIFGGIAPSAGTATGTGELGVKFHATRSGSITAVWLYKASGDTATTHKLSLWDASGNRLGTLNSASEPASGWFVTLPAAPIVIPAGDYTVSYGINGTAYVARSPTPPVVAASLTFIANVVGTLDTYPTGAGSAYAMVDIQFAAIASVDLTETAGSTLTGIPVVGAMPVVGAAALYLAFAQRGYVIGGTGAPVAELLDVPDQPRTVQ